MKYSNTILFLLPPSLSSTHQYCQSLKTSWITPPKHLKTISPPRSGHVSFRVDDDDALYTFGGYAETIDEKTGDVRRYVTNDLWRWNSRSGWEEVVQSDAPGPRLASAAAVVNNRPVLFGGWDPQTPGTGGIILDTIHRYDPSRAAWTHFPSTIPQGPTSRHVALSLSCGTRAVLHNHRCLDHVLLYDDDDETITIRPTSGTAPSPRGLHAAAMSAGNDKMVVFGGAAQDGSMSNEVFVLDIATWTWTAVDCGGDGEGRGWPSPRASPCLCAWSEEKFLLFGGAETSSDGGGLTPLNDLWCLDLGEAGAR
eukprot:CAMPEP_0172500416 /NCGR_PEP_ID=MMETSP1066-20121228/137996_1 /TAXON_ID=671091 /ORGANISM="Coscinodiscus wailesii, Strain CCMP2513" /LENGTH=309 /DNA_ID=CAMNT_0013274633 /DNA_START=100 /DNA_END=1026 /DNA_ORIENTATION=+